MNGGGTTRRRRALVLTCALVALLPLAACTGDDPPTPPPTSTTAAATTSISQPPAVPIAPDAEATINSAKAFVRYFWDVHNYAYATLDPALLESISAPKCKFCKATISNIRDLRAADSTVNGSAVKLLSMSAPPVKITTGIIVNTLVSQDPGETIHRDGSVVKSKGVPSAASYVGLIWTGTNWRVDDVAIEKTKAS
jgi:Family of unknown function (DUF6318)